MIYINKNGIQEENFVALLEKTRENSLNILSGRNSGMSGDEFETFVFEKMKESSVGTEFENTVKQTGAHAFPDIIAKKYFGVEVKVTTGNKWVSTGNSVLETTRIDDVKRIFLFFGKLGGDTDIRFRLYEECLYDIGVTHSPRYKINMELEIGKSIFDKMKIDYELFRSQSNLIAKVKDYYRSQLKDGEELWWIDQMSEEGTVAPIIKSYDTLERKEREKFFIESMILFPEIFGRTQTKFERVAAYLITAYNTVSSSLRDKFTAGGQQNIQLKGKEKLVPKIYFNLYSNASNIASVINEIDEERISYYWRISKIPSDKLAHWKGMLRKTAGKDAVEIFEAGLKYGKKA
ncbi:MAG: hypothetical protein UR69_C0002G0208 [Candidatus Moranbacteria bacterium GW2011_GWE2_35_2-]|nr:MAG: hypothetical protein UR69_C0002G0208 [Candidatus Moranbacteria bacterium GW2011_GWE2_35_2-]KKQ22443.1 MAG: hypothetical protein US37_C0002G0068 [Candidatus Moranbacteria bacterium GW2011_GWF2_37_11]KKQ29512.1 MAG: hypothetical protein US44_C0001G0104 [Candidatus Moranbacteria bacterium GW2011_GWD1_37_17]KKQ30618.1 MAG: hypothetical protein US47_C0002G0208 [Candidatus Moranbacteria bacterium GW2011_GWE1_37_24]KKQ48158.1 MAG: hypothetical protein US66_C0001G0022 [Candidatus Moranbacteria 